MFLSPGLTSAPFPKDPIPQHPSSLCISIWQVWRWRDATQRNLVHSWPSCGCGRRTRPRSRSAPAAQPATKLETAGYFAAQRRIQQPRPRRKPGRNSTVGSWRVASLAFTQTLLARARPRLPDRAQRHGAPHDPRRKPTKTNQRAFPRPPSSAPVSPTLSRSLARRPSSSSADARRVRGRPPDCRRLRPPPRRGFPAGRPQRCVPSSPPNPRNS